MLKTRNIPSYKVVVFHEKYRTHLQQSGISQGFSSQHQCFISFAPFHDTDDILTGIIKDYCIHHNLPPSKIDCTLYLFYSVKDLWISIGFESFQKLALRDSGQVRPKIQQKRNLRGSFSVSCEDGSQVQYTIKDLAGWSAGGLESLAVSVGILSKDKSLLDKYKTCMEDGLLKHPHDFLRYGINDVELLEKIVWGQLKLINWLCKDIIHIKTMFTKRTIPFTQGRLVSDIFTNYLNSLLDDTTRFPKENAPFLLQAAFAKIGVLNSDAGKAKENLAFHHEVFDGNDLGVFTSSETLEKLKQLRDRARGMYSYQGYSQSSTPFYLEFFTNNTGIFNSLVSGGRCVNERSFETRREFCADIDLSSCYGSALTDFTYPIGLPTVYATSPNQSTINLGTFLKTYGHLLVDNLYKITVSGKLPFEQDLIFSKITTKKRLQNTRLNFEEKWSGAGNNTAHLDSDFVLLRREISNGVITSDVLEFLKAVCSRNEWKCFMSLDVVTAVYWSAEDRCDSLDEWVEKILTSSGEFLFDRDHQSVSDKRSRTWYGLSLDLFIGRLVRYRKELKKNAKNCSDTQEKLQLNAKEKAIKLIVNTFYGCTASPYFTMGNTVLADNITCRARVECYKLAKALALCQSITDGGNYSLMHVYNLKKNERKPSLLTLSNIEKLEVHRGIKITLLGDVDWAGVFKNTEEHERFRELDFLAGKHLDDFWNNYGLEMKISVEHKAESTALKVAFFSKAHYLQLVWDPEVRDWSRKLFKIRGAKLSPDLQRHPCYTLLEACLEGRDLFELELAYDHSCLLKLAQWNLLQKSTTAPQEQKNVRPGERLVQRRHYRINNMDKPINTVEDYNRRLRRGRRKDAVLFERYLPKGLDYMIKKMLLDDLKSSALPKKKDVIELRDLDDVQDFFFDQEFDKEFDQKFDQVLE